MEPKSYVVTMMKMASGFMKLLFHARLFFPVFLILLGRGPGCFALQRRQDLQYYPMASIGLQSVLCACNLRYNYHVITYLYEHVSPQDTCDIHVDSFPFNIIYTHVTTFTLDVTLN